MRRLALAVLIFVAASLIGPLVRWLTWPPSSRGDVADFMYGLILLLWPAQPISVIEASTGTLVAIATSVVANVVLFGVVGVFAGAFGKKRAALVVLYIGTLSLLVVFAVWAFGLSFTYSEILALLVAAALYALPFFVVFRLRHKVVHGR